MARIITQFQEENTYYYICKDKQGIKEDTILYASEYQAQHALFDIYLNAGEVDKFDGKLLYILEPNNRTSTPPKISHAFWIEKVIFEKIPNNAIKY